MEKISIIESLLNGSRSIKDTDVKKIIDEQFTICEKNTLIRLLHFYRIESTIEFLSELRQCILLFRRSIRVPGRILRLCEEFQKRFGFIINPDQRYVDVKIQSMTEYPDLAYNYDYVYRRKLEQSFADGTLVNYFGFDSYISLQQKLMIHCLKYLCPGEAYMACIPTGSGKSLLWQYAVARGQFDGVTIVVVPTVALGLDHKKSDEEKLTRVPWIESIAYSSKEYANNELLKNELCEKIKKGKHKIIYISPEGLTNYDIQKALLEAASNKNISAIVIDEAHLVIDWGMQFRPEFQFLPALCAQLQARSMNSINTILLSATFSDTDRDVLMRLFGENGLVEFRGDELRPEIEYFTHYCKTEPVRKTVLEKLVDQIPKPAIIYVGTLDQCEEYYDLIKASGFCNIQKYTGKLKDKEKEKVLDAWRNNECSIMVATSAFGMGVDKPDVRTVITAYTPENVSRYYQEVGRAGRDGFSALNFALFCPDFDQGIVRSYTDSKVIGVDNLSERWSAMIQNQKNDSPYIEANCMWLDTDTPPGHLKYDRTGTKNSAWNEDVIALMGRAGILDIVDVRRMYSNNHKHFRIKVKLKNELISVSENKKDLEAWITEFRNREREEINEGKALMKEMFLGKNGFCFSEYFLREFWYAETVCVGCPSCRKNQFEHMIVPGKISLNLTQEREVKKSYRFNSILSRCTDTVSFGTLTYDTTLSQKELNELVCKLIINNATIIVLDTTEQIRLDQISFIGRDDYLILSKEEFLRLPDECLWGTIVFFVDQEHGSDLMRVSSELREYRPDLNQIIVAPRGYKDVYEDRFLSDFTEYGRSITIINEEESIC